MNKNSDAEKAKKDFEMKIEKLETEKNLLVDENFGLRLQILDLKALLQVKSNQVNAQGELSPSKNPFCDNFVTKDGPWQFPKQTTKSRQFGMDPLKTAVPLMNSFGALTDMEDNEIWQNAPNYENQQVLFPRGLGNKEKLTKTVNSIIMNTAPSEKRFEDNIVTNRQVIDERRKEKKNVVPCEKTWAEAAKTGSTETIRDKLNTTQYSPQVSRQNTVKFRHHQEGRPNDVQITQDTRADFTWEDFDEDADQHKWSFNGKEKRKPVVSIIGDSILGGIRKQEMNKHVRGNFTIVKSFKGATVNDMESYIIPTLNRKPDGLIIHCGTNDLRDSEPTEIARKITKLAVNASKTVKNVAVSSILARGDSELIDVKRRKVNIALEKELENSRIELIKHEYIEREWENMLYKDGIHLNQDGTNALGGDFVSFLNSVCQSKFIITDNMNYTDTVSINASITLSPTMAAASNSTVQTDTQFLSPDISLINSPQLSLGNVLSTSSDASEPVRNAIEEFFHMRVECARNLLIGFLNINSLRNKITDLRMIAERCLPDILLIEETKLNSDFKTDLFLIDNY